MKNSVKWVLVFILNLGSLAINAQDIDSVKLYLKWDHQYEFAGYYAAIEKGYFLEAGLHVELDILRSTDAQVDSVVSKEGVYAIANSNILQHWVDGKEIVMVLPVFQHSSVVFFTHKDANIRHPQDLKGKRIVIPRILYPELEMMMYREGIDPSTTKIDYEWRYKTFENKEADAIVNLSLDIGYVNNSEGINILHPINYGVDFYGENVYTSRKEIRNNPERVTRFREAIVRGWNYALENPKELIQMIRSRYNPDLDSVGLAREYEEIRILMEPDVVPVGHNNRGRWEKMQSDLYDYGAIETKMSMDGFFYEDYYSTPEERFNNLVLIVGIVLAILFIFLVAQYIINRRLNTLLSKRMEEINSHNEELKKMNSELDNFVYRVSHDLRAPISSSLGLLNLIERESYNNIEEYNNLIRKSLLKLDDFILDILHYSRNSRMEVRQEKINIRELLNEVIGSIGHQATKIDFKMDVVNCKDFHGDRNRLTIILNNLIANAYRYGDLLKEDPFVKVSARCDDQIMKMVIEDNGIGIPEEHLSNIFDMFYRAHHERTGSGLGLYIVGEVIEKLGGQISVDSTLYKGTKVTVKIPNSPNSEDR